MNQNNDENSKIIDTIAEETKQKMIAAELDSKENIITMNGLRFEIKAFNVRTGEMRIRLIKENQVKIG